MGPDLRTWQAVPVHTLMMCRPLASNEKFS